MIYITGDTHRNFIRLNTIDKIEFVFESIEIFGE